jgi:uncharacterized Zn-binding protein involved in type VI secretion
MTSAAFVGSGTSHGPPLSGKGSSKVKFEGRPAWRAKKDRHSCPLTSPNPHGQGIVERGSPKVIIDRCQAVRVRDTIKEAAGGANIIQVGSRTVIIK